MSCHPLYWVALQQAIGPANRKIKTLLDFFGTPEGVFDATPQELARCPGLTRKEVQAILAKPYEASRKIWDTCKQEGIWILTPESAAYPDGFRNLADMPCAVYGRGRMPDFSRLPSISVVGTRKPTPYGKLVAHRIATVLAAAGMVVVSGGALGIDSCAHRAAIDVKGLTVAVLGCGHLSGYLKANRDLRESILRFGAVISEYPPFTGATAYTFPVRNRLIAALTLGTVVIEAGEKSGSLITANAALEQGKDVYAVPGSIMSQAYKGSNRMIADGAIPVFCGMDVANRYASDYFQVMRMDEARAWNDTFNREILTHTPPVSAEPVIPPEPEKPVAVPPEPEEKPKKLSPSAGKDLKEPTLRVYNTFLRTAVRSADEIAGETQLPTGQILRQLSRLEMEGLIERQPDGSYRLIPSDKE